MSKTYRKEPDHPKARSTLPRPRHHIFGYPREHYTIDHKEKAQFKNQESAEAAARNRTARYGEPFDAYQCRYCGCWHIGHRKMLPVEKEALLLKQTIEGELTIIKRYKDDLNQIAQSQLALFEKIEHLEETVQNHYRELFLMNYKILHPELQQ